MVELTCSLNMQGDWGEKEDHELILPGPHGDQAGLYRETQSQKKKIDRKKFTFHRNNGILGNLPRYHFLQYLVSIILKSFLAGGGGDEGLFVLSENSFSGWFCKVNKLK